MSWGLTLASANPGDMPLVSPNLLQHEDDMKEMIAGVRFFLHAMGKAPLASRIERIALPATADYSDEALREHCKAFVKTNYHPAGTARMGSDEHWCRDQISTFCVYAVRD